MRDRKERKKGRDRDINQSDDSSGYSLSLKTFRQ